MTASEDVEVEAEAESEPVAAEAVRRWRLRSPPEEPDAKPEAKPGTGQGPRAGRAPRLPPSRRTTTVPSARAGGSAARSSERGAGQSLRQRIRLIRPSSQLLPQGRRRARRGLTEAPSSPTPSCLLGALRAKRRSRPDAATLAADEGNPSSSRFHGSSGSGRAHVLPSQPSSRRRPPRSPRYAPRRRTGSSPSRAPGSKSSPGDAATPASFSMRAAEVHAVVGETADVGIDVEGAVDGKELAEPHPRQPVQQQRPARRVAGLHRLQFLGRVEGGDRGPLREFRAARCRGSARSARPAGPAAPAAPSSRSASRSCSSIWRRS